MTSNMENVCWHPTDSGRLSFCGDEKSVEVWDVRAQKAAAKINCGGNLIHNAWSPNGNYMAVGSRFDHLFIIDMRQFSIITKHKFPYEVNEFAWTVNSDHILATTGGEPGVGAVDVVSFQNNKLEVVSSVTAHSSNCMSIAMDRSYRKMAVGSIDFLVSLWDLDDLICHHSFSMESEVRDMSYSGDGKFIAAVSEDPVLAICDADTGDFVCKINSRYKANSLSWHPKRNLLAVSY
eukprot:CAMPEP_0170128898 /NCGR_PEP_ID=MMETSP0020_2-20130122/21485_1 /TAXON_ID=98059 /ORGANISM="Dinobryon sp., Strain UTEXLB2267" /LENGTH=234 /DNA_ID=CAMNT_0010362987 /DNA_START=73 /DNA_END=774 /DNA_ORIENTATION=-